MRLSVEDAHIVMTCSCPELAEPVRVTALIPSITAAFTVLRNVNEHLKVFEEAVRIAVDDKYR